MNTITTTVAPEIKPEIGDIYRSGPEFAILSMVDYKGGTLFALINLSSGNRARNPVNEITHAIPDDWSFVGRNMVITIAEK